MSEQSEFKQFMTTIAEAFNLSHAKHPSRLIKKIPITEADTMFPQIYCIICWAINFQEVINHVQLEEEYYAPSRSIDVI